jgi:SAM-dependent methyltransferase
MHSMLATIEFSATALGTIADRPICLSSAALQIASTHAQRIATSLGNNDAESSLAGYWSLRDRLEQWQQLLGRIGPERACQLRFVEVGSGMGLFTLTGAALGLDIVGFEASSDRYLDSLLVARLLFADNGLPSRLVQGYAECLPLADQSVDVVVSFQTLEHVADLPQTLREMRRILKPGGILFAQAPNYASFYEAHYGLFLPLGVGKSVNRRLLQLYGRPERFLDHLQWLHPEQLRRLLGELNFSTYTVGPITPVSSPIPPLPVEIFPSPFRLQRGRASERLANRLAGVVHRLTGRPDWYTQLEIWANV